MRILCIAAMVAAGCAAKAPVDDDFSGFADGKEDIAASAKFLGWLGHDLAQPYSFKYTRTPRYRMVAFKAIAGDTWDISVSSPSGDAVTWLLDYQHKVVAFNDDASSDTLDSHIHVVLPASNGNYYIVMRDYDLHVGTFTVQATGGHPDDAAGDAERAYDRDLAQDNVDAYRIARAGLPTAARAKYDAYLAKVNNADAFRIATDAGATVFVVRSAVEEQVWADLYDAHGDLLVHGCDGDSGPEISSWGCADDPTKQ